MLVPEPKIFNRDPILSAIAELNGNASIIEYRVGVYGIGHFGSSEFLRPTYEHYPDFPQVENVEYRNCYGVCDSVENLLEVFPELETSERKFVVTLTSVSKDTQPSSGGWRWHKWGPYIGKQDPQCDYIFDEPVIEQVYCYHIYERLV